MLLFLVCAASIFPYTAYSLECISGKRKAVINNPAGYFQCVNRIWVSKQCLEGQEFNVSLSRCEDPNLTVKTCNIGDTRTYLDDNSKYESCDDGLTWSVRSCQQDYAFSDGQCILSSTATTSRPLRPTVENEYCTESAGRDGFKSDSNDCTKYLQCFHGYWMQRRCGPGTAWDHHNLTCNHYGLVCKNRVDNKLGEHS